jgi:hypothetical protein
MPLSILSLRRAVTNCAFFFIVVALLPISSCESSSAPNCPLDGSWAWELNRNPSGSSLDLTLAAAGNLVAGTGIAFGIGPTATADSIAVSGSYAPSTGSFDLTLSYRSGRVVTYSASLSCPDRLQGTASSGGSPYALVFYRGTNP